MTTDTRTALLDAAETAARARGIDGFSYATLAETVGIRKASIHYHFPTKAALSSALMDRYTSEMMRACADIDGRYSTGGERLRALIEHYRQALNGGETLCLCVAFSGNRNSLSEDVGDKVDAFRTMVLTWIASAFVRGRDDGSIAGVADPMDEAHAALALCEGGQIAARAKGDLAPFDAALSLILMRL